MQRFEILPHTADVAVRAVASDKEGLLSALVRGMFAAAGPRTREGSLPARRGFAVRAADFPALIVDVLNEAVFLAGTSGETYEDIAWRRLTDTEAEGEFIGAPADGFDTEIKAATHHGLRVARDGEGNWETVVVFDA